MMFNKREVRIKEIANKLLSEGKVDIVVGHRKGSIPLKNVPFFASTPEDTDHLVFRGSCGSNLANFLLQFKDKHLAVVAQGCVSRNIIGLIKEDQLQRDNLYIIGVPCIGMIDMKKVARSFPGEVLEAHDDEQVILKGRDFEITLDRSELMRDNCLVCNHRNPQVADEIVVDKVEEQHEEQFDDIKKIDALTPSERRAFFQDMFSTCIRCNACRDACPLCYCSECFADKSTPQWCGKSQDPRDVLSYHMIKAFHSAGRCTDCGACEDACPMGIKVRFFIRGINKYIIDHYDGFEASLDIDAEPLLTTFKTNDPEPFMTKE